MRLLLGLISLCVASPAFALSCVESDPLGQNDIFFVGTITQATAFGDKDKGDVAPGFRMKVRVDKVWTGVKQGEVLAIEQLVWQPVFSPKEARSMVGEQSSFALSSKAKAYQFGICGSPYFAAYDEEGELTDAFKTRLDELGVTYE